MLPQVSPPKKPNLNPAYFPVYEDDNECIICQEDMKDNNSLKLQCGHRFHKAVSSNVMYIYMVYVAVILIWLIGKFLLLLQILKFISICISYGMALFKFFKIPMEIHWLSRKGS